MPRGYRHCRHQGREAPRRLRGSRSLSWHLDSLCRFSSGGLSVFVGRKEVGGTAISADQDVRNRNLQ